MTAATAFRLAVALALLLLAPRLADADTGLGEGDARLLCDPNQNLAVIQFSVEGGVGELAVPDDLDDGLSKRGVAASASNECRFKNGTSIAFEKGRDEAVNFGQCAGSPDDWIDLWVDRKKVFRHRAFAGCDHQFLYDVVIDPSVISLCTAKDDSDPYSGVPDLICAPFVNTDYPGLPDYSRFPPTDVLPGSADTYVQYAAESEDRCRALDRADDTEHHLVGRPDARQNSGVRLLMDDAARFDVDLDNDGNADEVLVTYGRSRTGWGDTLEATGGRPRDQAASPSDHDRPPRWELSISGDNTILGDIAYIGIMQVNGRTFLSITPALRPGKLRKVIMEGDPVLLMRTVCVFAHR